MSATFEQIEQEALSLPPEERARLAGKLWESLDVTVPISESWKREIERRERQVDEGEVALIRGETVLQEARNLAAAASR